MARTSLGSRQRGKRTIGVGNPQGGAIGTVGVETAKTPFQSFDVPIFDEGAKSLTRLQKAGDAGVALLDEISKDASNAGYLGAARSWMSGLQDLENAWTAGSGSPNAAAAAGAAIGMQVSNKANGIGMQGPAIGKGANKAWFDQTNADMAAHMAKVKATPEYQNLRSADQKALDTVLQNGALAYRGKALLHMRTQTKSALTSELTALNTGKKDDAVGAAGNPGVAHTALATMISSVQEEARMLRNTTLKDTEVRVAATEAMDEVAQKSIVNLLNSKDPNRAEQARQWMALNTTVEVDGHKISLSDDKKNDLNQLIANSVVGEIGRAYGNVLFATHGDDAGAAAAELEINKSGHSLATKQAAHAQYGERLRIVSSQKTRTATDRYNQAMIDAGNGKKTGETILNQLPAKQKREVEAELQYAQKLAIEGDVSTKPSVKREWDGLLDKDRAKLDYADFLLQYGNHFNTADGTRSAETEAWRKAKEKASSKHDATVIRLNNIIRASKKSASSIARTSFNTLVTKRTARLYKGNSGSDKAKRAAFVEAALSEFNDRNTDERPLPHKDILGIIEDLSARISIDGDEHMAFNVITDARDEDDDTLPGTEDVRKAFSGVAVENRFEVMQWYRRSKGLTSKDSIKIKDVGAFIHTNITLAETPEAMVPQLDAAMRKFKITVNKTSRDEFYRLWLIDKNGR